MKILRLAALCAMCLLVSVGCNGTRKGGDSQSDVERKGEAKMENNKGKVLIVFFSHAGENYSVGNIKEGNTKLVADEIQRVTGGDVFEIVADKDYNMPYEPLTRLAQEEARKGELPSFNGEVKDIQQYDTVFIGGPVWWGTYPRVMFTFFEKYDLNGKTLIPFTTHEGSGLGNVVSDLKAQYPKATVTGAFSMYGHEVRSGKEKIDKWLKGLGY